ncbi:hypothetical protein E8E13_002274 [Curvularia kusanoi]|uniref:Uncharacterized protein n=1 Tax=Curvularia kusanoi TaxID=90978 RepID=A0A9P4T4M3_CURKU|nr:hypothetical protein E8E13_002274 [Curvularia kusanoi]
MHYFQIFYLVFSFVWSAVAAQNNRTANVSDEDTKVGWQSGSSERGTLTLVYSCLITIFSCTWTVLHLNVPPLGDSAFRKALRKAKWMLITALFPEFIFSKAICDLRLALEDLYKFKQHTDGKENEYLQRTEEWNSPDISFISSPPTTFTHTWLWGVEFRRRERLLCWILRVGEFRSSSDGIAETIADNKDRSLRPPQVRVSDDTWPDSLEELSVINAATQTSLGSEQGERIGVGRRTKAYQTLQLWTLTHTYLANMSGIVYADRLQSSYSGSYLPRYTALWASMIGPDYKWSTEHPLKYLVLSKQDIEDKSKADWLLKGLAVLQISWLVLSVLVRGVKRLPVSQLEIATLAFAVFAVATYAANTWKPKDVAYPIKLDRFFPGSGEDKRGAAIASRLTHPRETINNDRVRRRNDYVWMEGDFPLMYTLMAISALAFGGLHCLAWNFEFPSFTDQMLWRLAAVVSALLPALQLALNVLSTYLILRYAPQLRCKNILRELEPFKNVDPEFRRLITKPDFISWTFEELTALVITTDFSQRPSNEMCNQLKEEYLAWEKLEAETFYLEQAFPEISNFFEMQEAIEKRQENIGQVASEIDCNSYWMGQVYENDQLRLFWESFENDVRTKLTARGIPLPDVERTGFLPELVSRVDKRDTQFRKWSITINRYVAIIGGIIYAASRLIIIVLLFTSLRAAPKGIYTVTPWTEYLPNFS